MSAVPKFTPAALQLAGMQPTDIAEVMEIELDVYPFPWTEGNFLDSLKAGYAARTLRDEHGFLVGYFLVMHAVDEAHLLNISVHRDLQGQGVGRFLLGRMIEEAQAAGMQSVLLEVRPSNTRALAVYERYGFATIGRRKGYYPAGAQGREDAIVMRYTP